MKTRITKLTLEGFKSFRKRVSIPLFPGFVVVCGPNGSGKCSRGDTQILLANGEFKPIKEIVESSLEKSETKYCMDDGVYTLENPYGLKVLGLDQDSLNIVEKDIASFIKREGEERLVKIITRSGREIVTTKYHPVMIFRNKKIKPIKVEELKQGELIAVPKEINIQPINDRIEIPRDRINCKERTNYWIIFNTEVPKCNEVKIPKKINKRFARFLGYIIGDGYIKENSKIDFTNNDDILIKDFIHVSRIFGIKPKLYEYVNKGKRVSVHSSLLARFIENLLNNKIRSKNKHIPKEILFSKKSVLSNFLGSLFDCDGYISKRSASFEYCTKSETLARQVQFALLRFGIYSRFVRKQKCATNTKERKKRTYFAIYVDGIENLKRMSEEIRFRSKEKTRRLKNHIFRPIEPQTNVDIFPKEVNDYIHRLALLLGVNIKKTRKRYPRFGAYYEDQCYPTRDGIQKSLFLLEYHKEKIQRLRDELSLDQKTLMKMLKESSLMIKDAAEFIGVSSSLVGQWYYGKKASRKHLLKLRDFLESNIDRIITESEKYLDLLRKHVDSNIIWDRIESIEEVRGEKWVYDLCIPNCHNFIGNLIFVHNSNILDSISFVLGKTSTKSMRADRLHELIYHGHKNIPSSEYASVTLWLDNSDKVFPFETPEISIKRKVNKKGVSLYKINGKTTTREKVLELLSSARIHPDGFNIIMQGDVSQVIEMTSQERREIIDQVAGISLYDEKKEKAQKNLDIVEQKLREVEIIITERLERLQALEQDRNTALKYQELIDRLKLLNASLSYKKYQTEQDKYQSIEKQVEENEIQIKKLEQEIKKLEERISANDERRQEITEKIFIRSKEAGIKQEIEDIKNKIIRNKDRIESDEREIERINKMIEKLRAIEGRTGFLSRAIQTILGLKKPDVYGTVNKLIKVPGEYRTAVEVAGGSRLMNLVVKNTGAATEYINFLKREKIGRATFLPLDRIKPRKLTLEQKLLLKKPGVIGSITSLIKFDPVHSSAIDYVFGDTIIVESLGVARQLGIGKIRMVTLDGDLVERSGAMIGGYYKGREKVASDIELEEYEQVKKDLEEEINFLRIEIGQLNEKMDKLRESLEKESKEVIDLENERTEIDERLEQMRQERNEKFEERVRVLDRINKLKIRSAKTEAEMNSLKLEVERYEKVEYLDEKPEVLEEKIEQTTSSLNALGLVNMKAIEEYEKFKVEFDELKNKYDEVRNEKQAIMDMIEKIEGKKKEVFYECLKSIDRNFREIFKDMAAGDASLELEDSLDITSGLIIQANPAGKRLLNIDAMSGGEKALTALAFLFSILKYKPAPFYALDEIDATLDKVNTKKVAEMIKKLSKKEQFIVITHNDYTIKQGDKVYGVSMSGGESKILGIEMPEK